MTGHEKERVMMMVVKKTWDIGISWEGEVGESGRLQHHETTSFSRCGQINICFGELRQDLQVVAIMDNTSVGGGTHEYGDWEVTNGGQEKVLKPLLKWGIKSRKDEEV